MGLPGAGKTTLAKELHSRLSTKSTWFNADIVRNQYNDWDFSLEGRVRQCARMHTKAKFSTSEYVICDFIAPIKFLRDMFNADYTIWVDTVNTCSYLDTLEIFEPPTEYDLRVTEQNAVKSADKIIALLGIVNG